jgi:Tfp pilus assembly protein PilO
VKKQVSLAPVIAVAILVVAAVGYFFLVKPKQDESGRLDEKIAELETQLQVAAAAANQTQAAQEAPVAIKVADLFRLTKAMPDDDDMAGIILELNSVASAAGVEFVSIAPQPAVVRTGYSGLPINLTFEGNFYDLTDFLFRLRNLVSVRDGKLDAKGRLFTLDSLDLHEAPGGFPQVEAALTLSAYLYSTTPAAGVPAAPTSTAPTATTATATNPTTTTPASEEQALGGTP